MIENAIDNEAKKLLSDDLTSADSEKEVKICIQSNCIVDAQF